MTILIHCYSFFSSNVWPAAPIQKNAIVDVKNKNIWRELTNTDGILAININAKVTRVGTKHTTIKIDTKNDNLCHATVPDKLPETILIIVCPHKIEAAKLQSAIDKKAINQWC